MQDKHYRLSIDMRIIASEERLYHAVISAEFALEELGKILLLKETMRNNPEDDPVEIDGEAFCSHDGKAKRAWSILDNKYKVLFQETWANAVWATATWSGKTEISNTIRLECAFVDFIDNHWTLRREIDRILFMKFLDHFEEKLKFV
jgi:hypothetical protein